MTTPLLGQSRSELQTWVEAHQQPRFRAQQLHDWLYRKGVRSFDEIQAFPKTWRSELANYPIGRSAISQRSLASDGTLKLLLQLADGETVETVGIPSERRLTVCVSSQVGCAMACDFCATGKGGLKRNLAVHEILDQVLTIQSEMAQRVSHIVFMGMGEPLHNLPNVIKAVQRLNEDIGIGQRHITVSTVGIPKQIPRLASYNLQITLAVSLHAPNQALRSQLVPAADRYPLTDLMHDCREYVATTGRRLSFEYILLGGVNDHYQHAQELAQLVRGFQAHVNLLLYNPIREVPYLRPRADQVERFCGWLEAANVTATVRRSRGLDQDAACGQLRRRHAS